ncbi:hypothetical protein BsWGS_27744 [Bradybaena similaris]
MLGEVILLISVICSTLGGVFFNALEFPVKCSILRCGAAPYGCRAYVTTDERGCHTGCDYACGAPWCGLRPCTRLCVHGYVQDALGCNTCTCKDICQHKLCDTHCPAGHALDSNGCSVCQCKLQFPSCLAILKCYQGLCPDSCKCQPDCYDSFPLPDNPIVFAL